MGAQEVKEQPVFVSLCKYHTAVRHFGLFKPSIDRKQVKNNEAIKIQIGGFIDKCTRKELSDVLKCKVPKEAFKIVTKYWQGKCLLLMPASKLLKRIRQTIPFAGW